VRIYRNGEKNMPIITFEGPVIKDIEVKRELVKKLTDVACETFEKIPRDAFIVQIKENPPENIGTGGKLLVDHWKK